MRYATALATVAVAVLGLLTYEVVFLAGWTLAIGTGCLALYRATRVARDMDRFLDGQRQRTEVQRSEFHDRLDEG